MSEYHATIGTIKTLRAKAAGERAPNNTPWGDWICSDAADILEAQMAALTTARDDALEEAAKVAETTWKASGHPIENYIPDAIRALKGSKP